MSYSSAESKVSKVAELVASAEQQLHAAQQQVQSVIAMIDRATAGARDTITEIELQAAQGDVLWQRLKQRTDQVKVDVQGVRAKAAAIDADMEARRGE